MNAHLTKEIGGEFLYISSTDDELTIHTHEALWVVNDNVLIYQIVRLSVPVLFGTTIMYCSLLYC